MPRYLLACMIILASISIYIIWKKPLADKRKHNAVAGIVLPPMNEVDYLNGVRDTARLINMLDNQLPLEARNIGFTGTPSFSYEVFEQLCKVADEQTLMHLTFSRNCKMRVYGMWGLVARESTLALKRMKELKDDQAAIQYYDGCIEMTLPVCYLAAMKFHDARVRAISKQYKRSVGFNVAIKE